MQSLIFITLVLISLLPFQNVLARVTPQDIVNENKANYENIVKNYSPENKKKLEALSADLAQVNKIRTDQLEKNIEAQALILDEFQNRGGGNETEAIKDVRYWVTFAHEAVAYQAAKIYIYNLSSETNIQADSSKLINLVQSDLNSARLKVQNSQNKLKVLIK